MREATRRSGSLFLACGIVIVALATTTAQAAPLRVLLQPPLRSPKSWLNTDRGTCVTQCLAFYLRDWLEEDPGILLVDEPQARSILGHVLNPALSRRPDNRCIAARDLIDVDAVLLWTWTDGSLVVELHRPAGTAVERVPWRDSKDAADGLGRIETWLAAELKTSAPGPLRRGLAAGAPGLIEDFYASRWINAGWVYNTGEQRIDRLRPYLSRLPGDPWTAAGLLRAGTQMTLDARTVDKPTAFVPAVQQAIPAALGTEWEPLAVQFCRVNKYLPAAVEAQLVALIRFAGLDEVDALLESDDDAADTAIVAAPAKPASPAAQAGAVRCLGAMKSRLALREYARTGTAASPPPLRRATAWALAQYPGPDGDRELETLRKDSDPPTAFLAAWAATRRGQDVSDLAARAAACVAVDPSCMEAWETIASSGGEAEVEKLRPLLASHRPAIRRLAAQGLARSGRLDDAGVGAVLADPDGTVVDAAVESLTPPQIPRHRQRLESLANHPEAAVAEAARLRLAAVAPAEPAARRRFELAVEHPYVRRQIVTALAREATPEAVAELVEATRNADAHTRSIAVLLLAQRAPAAAREPSLRLLAEPHVYVRLHAAAATAQVATADDAKTLEAFHATETDAATRLHLADAVARARGGEPPPPPQAANQLRLEGTTPFLCDHGEDCVDTPIPAYYDLAYRPDEPARRAHAAGKVFIVRPNNTVFNPLSVLLDTIERDRFWIGMQEEFGDIAALDGFMVGEESMGFPKWAGWPGGWRLFCREAGIPPARVNGDREKLSPAEQQAWWQWEQRVAIEGFNAIYDWIKLSFGKRRPGFLVATRMPDEGGPCEFDRQWKFDIGAGYYYETGNRHRYAQIRRFKTIWPDRPVMWLVDGTWTGGSAPLNYTFKPLVSPLPDPLRPAYADAICAWTAGADPGFFVGMLAMAPGEKPGPKATGIHMQLEKIAPAVMQHALDQIFTGVAELYRTKAEMKSLEERRKQGEVTVGDEEDEFQLEEKDPEADPVMVRIRREREALRLGIRLEEHLTFDVARLLDGLPRPTGSCESLLVGDVGDGRRFAEGGLCIPERFDCLDDVVKMTAADLAGYRFIGISARPGLLLRDEPIRSVTAWLEKLPGLLYVRGWLPTDPAAELAGVTDLDGRLTAAWPWANDVALEGGKVRIRVAESARDVGDGFVLWQRPGFRGAVLFDPTELEPEAVRKAINAVHADRGIGVAFTQPPGIEVGGAENLSAAVSGGVKQQVEFALQGVDLLTGIRGPTVGKGRGAALVADDYRGRYVASHGGVAVLCERPIVAVHEVEGGLEVESAGGLVKAVSASPEPLEVRGPVELAAVAAERVLPWMLEGRENGIALVVRDPPTGSVTIVRTPPGKVLIRRR